MRVSLGVLKPTGRRLSKFRKPLEIFRVADDFVRQLTPYQRVLPSLRRMFLLKVQYNYYDTNSYKKQFLKYKDKTVLKKSI